MLFLHALLFSLLATSTLAIPVQSGETSVQASTTEAPDPVDVDGVWLRGVSEHRSFYLIRY